MQGEDAGGIAAGMAAPRGHTAAERAQPELAPSAPPAKAPAPRQGHAPPDSAPALGSYRPAASRSRARGGARLRSSLDGEPPTRRRGIGAWHKHAVLAAGLAGALAYAGATGFGRHTRGGTSLEAFADGLLVRAGLGINEMTLSGHVHTSDRAIFEALGTGGTTLLRFDVAAARQRIEALAWVERATITRVFPDTVRIEVHERQAQAVWIDGEHTSLIDGSGRVLAKLAGFVPPHLPRLAGTGAPEAAGELLAAVQRHPGLAERLHLARRIGQRRWDLILHDGMRIRLAAGPTGQSLERLARLEREAAASRRAGETIDLTSARTVAIVAGPAGAQPSPRL